MQGFVPLREQVGRKDPNIYRFKGCLDVEPCPKNKSATANRSCALNTELFREAGLHESNQRFNGGFFVRTVGNDTNGRTAYDTERQHT